MEEGTKEPKQMLRKAQAKRQSKAAVILPGIGSEQIHLGQLEREVRDVLGKHPTTIRTFRDSYFYIYKDDGVDLDFGRKGGRLKVIFFYRHECEGHKAARVITDRGVRPGDSRSTVLKLYGEPDDQHDSKTFDNGFYLREWFYYASGIQFQFGSDCMVDIISVSRKKKSHKRGIRR